MSNSWPKLIQLMGRHNLNFRLIFIQKDKKQQAAEYLNEFFNFLIIITIT